MSFSSGFCWHAAGSGLLPMTKARIVRPGDVVFYVSSREAALGLDPWFVPVDATIVGIVDHVPGAET